jgi:hypothetical protein
LNLIVFEILILFINFLKILYNLLDIRCMWILIRMDLWFYRKIEHYSSGVLMLKILLFIRNVKIWGCLDLQKLDCRKK